MWQDSEWEEARAGDAEDHNLLYSVDAASFSRPSCEQLDAMAKVLNEMCDYIYIYKWILYYVDYVLDMNRSVGGWVYARGAT